MRDSPLVVLTVTLLTFNVSAQITSVKEYPVQFDRSRQTWYEVVENQDSRSILAMSTTFNCRTRFHVKSGRSVSSGSNGEYDALGNPVDIFEGHKGIPPGGVAAIGAADPSNCSGGVDAVIFSDGYIEGSSPSVYEYRQRWSSVREGIIQSLPLLAKVVNQKADLAEVEDALRQRMESIPDISGQRWGERAVYFQLQELLRVAREHPKPASEEVEADGRPRKQAPTMAIVLVNKLQEWKTALENGLGSPATR